MFSPWGRGGVGTSQGTLERQGLKNVQNWFVTRSRACEFRGRAEECLDNGGEEIKEIYCKKQTEEQQVNIMSPEP